MPEFDPSRFLIWSGGGGCRGEAHASAFLKTPPGDSDVQPEYEPCSLGWDGVDWGPHRSFPLPRSLLLQGIQAASMLRVKGKDERILRDL